ncbi:hypothetical protein JET76_15390 [Pseudomonas putida]|uniref:hypothetical protein n=1 Tax=Pseudomonas putida TaxID=303 RepID=UPI0018E6CAD2|nr:hypothetical protein [Pseudomonas putida]MBI6942736.1 hypothetical protein [Pseudomonas putida]MBI6958783.1 hypothetical protein [Pseudomonas putida]
MAVDLKGIPGLARRPKRPRLLLWSSLLLWFMLFSWPIEIFFTEYWGRQINLWTVLVVSFLIWLILICVRLMAYAIQNRIADGWDEARAQDLSGRYHLGRRSLQVLGVRMCTALNSTGETSEQLITALISGNGVIRTQPYRLDGAAVRHSRLESEDDADPETVLIKALAVVVRDLAQVLAKMPDDRVLNFLLEADSKLEESTLRRIWQYVWRQSGIRHSLVAVSDSGLGALDQWLDQESGQEDMLLVIAFQFLPEQPTETAEVVTGLLLGGRKAPPYHAPIAFIHRPEFLQKGNGSASDSALQALDWVPIDASSIEHVWRAGIDKHLGSLVTMMLASAQLPVNVDRNMHDLDMLLGCAGKAAPWLVIAIVVQSIQVGAGAQFVVSGDGFSSADLWGGVVTPVLPRSV